MMWRNWNPSTLLMGKYNGTRTMENSLADFKTNIISHIVQKFHFKSLPKRNEDLCLEKDLYAKVHSSTFHKSQKENNPNIHQLVHGNKLWYFHIMEYHSAVKKNKLLVHATIEKIVKNMLSERSQTKKMTYCTVLFIRNFRKVTSIETENRSKVGWDLRQKGELTANQHKGTFCSDGRILKLNCFDDGTTV